MIWEYKRLLAEVRDRIGNPSKDLVPDQSLVSYVQSATSHMASVLDSSVETMDPGIALEEDVFEYVLPNNLIQVVWAEFNDNFLKPSSVAAWVRDGIDWRSAESSTPQEFAVQNHRLLLWPPPGEDALADDPYLVVSYQAAPTGEDPTTFSGFADDDLWCLVYMAAAEYLGVHPSEDPGHVMRLESVRSEVTRRLPELRKRRERSSTLEVKRLSWGRRRAGVAR